MFWNELLNLDYTTYPHTTLTPQGLSLIQLTNLVNLFPVLSWNLYLKDYLLLTFFLGEHTSVLTTTTPVTSNLELLVGTTPVISFTLKVVLSICLLITIRGGVPRYRYDFLTKLGWVKFLTLVLSLFYLTFLLKIFY